MARWYEFAVVQLATRSMRDEKLNVGVVVVGERLDIRPGRNLDKIRAISHAISPAVLRDSMENISELDLCLKLPTDDAAARLKRISSLTGLEFGPIGKFEAFSAQTYEEYVKYLTATLVEPESVLQKRSRTNSKLVDSLKSEFRSRRILAREGEDISSHRVVLNWKLNEGLLADFALQNGALHLMKIVDAGLENVSLRRVIQDIAVSSLVLETARVSYGHDYVKGSIIYSANSYNEGLALPSLETAAHQGAELINWASADDRRRFIDNLSDLAAPLPLMNVAVQREINASIQERSKLN